MTNTIIRPEFVDYKKYKKKIDDYFRKQLKKFAGISGIDQSRPRKLFWEIVEGREINLKEIHTRLTVYLAMDLNIHILVDEGRIHPEMRTFTQNWTSYLRKRIFRPYSIKFSQGVLDNIVSYYPFSEDLLALYQEYLSTTNHEKLKKLSESDSSKNFFEFWKQFRHHYGLLYNHFEKLCKYIGQEIGSIEEKDLNNLYKIFQLFRTHEKPSERSPINYKIDLNQFLQKIIHLKNGIVSHSHYQFIPQINPQELEIWDLNAKKEETFRQRFDRALLFNHLYCLNLLLRGIQEVALYFSFINFMAKYHLNHQVVMKCPYCNAKVTFIKTPNKKRVKCRNCRQKIRLID